MDKKQHSAIARSLTEALCDYFGIPFVEPQPARNGVVTTDGSNLNIRSYPSVNAQIIGSIPNRADVTVLGQTGNWYVVNYGGVTGYAAADYISV